MAKFKVGDRVNVFGYSTKWFTRGTKDLEIRSAGRNDYQVWESDKLDSWYVDEDQLEFANDPNDDGGDPNGNY